MIYILQLLLTLAVILLGVYIIVSIFLLALEKQPEIQQDSIANTIQTILVEAAILIFGIGSSLLNAGSTFVSHCVSFYPAYIFVGLMVFGAEMNTQYNNQILQSYDHGNTKYFQPLYADSVMPVANGLRVFYDLSVCWTNFYASRNRVVIWAAFDVLTECSEANWDIVANKTGIALLAPFQSLLDWIQSNFAAPFNFYAITFSIADAIAAWQPMLDCSCQDLTFFWNITLLSLDDPALHQFVNASLNAYMDIYTIPASIVINIFRNGFYTCREPTPEQQIICLSQRPPNITSFQYDTCQAFIYGFNWIDDVLAITFDQFFEFTDYTLPKIGPLISMPICVLVDLLANFLDILFHIDLVFGPATGPKVHYLQFVDVTTPFQHAYGFSNGVLQFFNALDIDVAQNFGCVVSNLLNATFAAFEFGTQTFILWTTNSTQLKQYMANYNKTIFINDLDEMGVCMDALLVDIDLPLGQIFQYTVMGITRILVLFINLFDHIDNDFETYIQGEFISELNDILNSFSSAAIGLGNFFRQLSLESSGGPCTLLDPADYTNINFPTVIDPFCALGNAVDSFVRFVIMFLQLLINSVVTLLESGFAVMLNNVFRLDILAIPLLEEVIQSIGDMLGYFFPDNSCVSGTTPRDQFSKFFVSILNITAIPIRLVNVAANIIRASGITPPYEVDPEVIVCDIITATYDVTVGNIFNIVLTGSLAGACIADSNPNTNITNIATTLWNFFGWDDADDSIRYILCEISNALIAVIEFLVKFFQDPVGTIFNEISSLVQQAIEAITMGIQQALDDLKTAFCTVVGYLRSIFTQLGGILSKLFSDMYNCVISCIELDCSNTYCDFTNIQVPNIPSFKKRDFCSSRKRSIDPTENNTDTTNYYSDMYGDHGDDYGYYTSMKQRALYEYTPDTMDPYLDQLESIPYWITDTQPCMTQLNMLRNSSLDSAMRHLIIMDYKKCLVSASLARTVDIILINPNPSSPPLLNPEFLYDPMIGIQLIRNLTFGMSIYLRYIFNQSPIVTWKTYATESGVNDPLSVRLGILLGMFGDMTYHSVDGPPFIKAIVKLGKIFYKYAITIWSNNGMPISEMISAIASVSYGNRTARVVNHVIFHPRWPEIVKRTTDIVPNWYERVGNYVTEKSKTTNRRLLNNRFALFRIASMISNAVKKSRHTYFGTEYTPTSPSDYMWGTTSNVMWGREEHGMSYIEDPFENPVSHNISDLNPFCNNSTGGFCINCQLLQNIIEGYINGITACLAKAKEGVIVDLTEFLEKTQLSSDVSLTQAMNSSTGSTETALVPFVSKTSSLTSGSINTAIISIVQWLADALTSAGNLTERFIINPAKFMTNTNPNDKDSWLYWAGFIAVCRFEDLGCTNSSPKGLGIVSAIKVTIYAYLIILAIGLVFTPSSFVMLILVALTVPLFFAVGYLVSPLCLIPTPIPTLPECLADDSLIFMNRFNKPCLAWDEFLPGLTTTTCPGSSQDYTRSFVDCTAPPYNFVDGMRNIFYAFEVHAPSVNNFFRDTTVPAFSWVYDIQYFNDRLTFDFGPSGTANDTWSSCNLVMSPNWIPAGFITLESGILLFIFSSPVVLVIGTILVLISMLLIIIMQIISSMSGIDFSRNLYFNSKKEMVKPTIKPTLKQKEPKPTTTKTEEPVPTSLTLSKSAQDPRAKAYIDKHPNQPKNIKKNIPDSLLKKLGTNTKTKE